MIYDVFVSYSLTSFFIFVVQSFTFFALAYFHVIFFFFSMFCFSVVGFISF